MEVEEDRRQKTEKKPGVRCPMSDVGKLKLGMDFESPSTHFDKLNDRAQGPALPIIIGTDRLLGFATLPLYNL